MKNNFFVIIALAAITLFPIITSCTKGDADDNQVNKPDVPREDDPTELLLSVSVEAQTKATFANADVQIPAGQTVAVWVHESTDAATQLYGKNVLTANGSGGLSGGTTMFFPQNDSHVDIYALHTNATWSGAEYPDATLTHTVRGDQQKLADYAVSDLLYARTTNVAKTTNAVPLKFYHLLSKLQVAIVPGEGVSASEITGITVDGTKLQAGFTLSKTSLPTAITVSPTGEVSPIKIGADISVSFSNPKYNDAIVVPQTVTAGTAFITLQLADGVELAYLLPKDTTFESNKKYFYHIQVSRNELKISTSIEGWTSGGVVTGEASHLTN